MVLTCPFSEGYGDRFITSGVGNGNHTGYGEGLFCCFGCSSGFSGNQGFGDGSHYGAGFSDSCGGVLEEKLS